MSVACHPWVVQLGVYELKFTGCRGGQEEEFAYVAPPQRVSHTPGAKQMCVALRSLLLCLLCLERHVDGMCLD